MEADLETLKSKVEAVLYITSRAMQPSEIAEILEVNQEELANMLTWMSEEEAMRLLKARESFQRKLNKE